MIEGNIFNREPCFFYEICVFNIFLETNPRKGESGFSTPMGFLKGKSIPTSHGWLIFLFFLTFGLASRLFLFGLSSIFPKKTMDFRSTGAAHRITIASACPTRSPGATRASARRATIAWCVSGTPRRKKSQRVWRVWGCFGRTKIIKKGRIEQQKLDFFEFGHLQ